LKAATDPLFGSAILNSPIRNKRNL
jgi:hypothetical protein